VPDGALAERFRILRICSEAIGSLVNALTDIRDVISSATEIISILFISVIPSIMIF
jgi:hypothetical protein